MRMLQTQELIKVFPNLGDKRTFEQFMKEKKILHITLQDKFIPDFINFLKQHFDDFDTRHQFFIFDDYRYPIERRDNIAFSSDTGKIRCATKLILQMYHAEKIILHGLFIYRVIQLLSLQPYLLKKCYWVIWGGDLYTYKFDQRTTSWWKLEISRRFVIKHLGHLVTYIQGDVDFARKWYGAKGLYHECLMYPSNLFKDYPVPPKTDDTINIQIGNSSDPSNAHIEIFDFLEKYKEENIKIFAPLAYGSQNHARKVAEVGKIMFGDKFVAMTSFMPFDEYLRFLGKIDIAIFNHRRQQAMGNIITLLGLGKKIYLRSDISTWQFLNNIPVKVFDVANLKSLPLTKDIFFENIKSVQEKFSHKNLFRQLSAIFND